MPTNGIHKFILSIVIPSILAIGLFILSIYVFILPSFEKTIMDKKKEMISELTNTAWSLLEEYNQEYNNDNFTLEEAQRMAASRIGRIRYGNEGKDYFWIIDMDPKMIMHPYRAELIDSNLTEYKDARGKKLFVEATKTVKGQGYGFIDYMWQWKDDSTQIVPKLSYVKGYKPWGWIIGTGIYIEDVKQEIRTLKSRLLRISLIITIVISLTLLFVMRQSLVIENKRKKAVSELLLSRQKYKSLVEASTEGTLLILSRKIIFSNLKFSKLIGYLPGEVLQLKFEDIFTLDWHQVVNAFDDPKKTVSFETQIKCEKCIEKDVIISASKIKYGEDSGYIIITKEVTRKKQLERETEHLAEELQSSLLLMNQPIKHFVTELIKCDSDTSVIEASRLMVRKSTNVLFVHKNNQILGVINNSDLKNRVVAAGFDVYKPVIEIMTSPVLTIPENSLLYEAVLLFNKNNISHLAVKSGNGEIIGCVSFEGVSEMQQNSVSYIIKEVEISESIEQLYKVHNRLPVLVNALIDSGDKTQNITRIITSVSDAIVVRVIRLAIEQLGIPPCEFAFMVMGSEGRMEQTLSTDQDNAIVFQDLNSEDLPSMYQYFQKLGNIVCDNLSKIGYKLCSGEVMASNTKWSQPLSVWKEYFSGWINNSDPQSILEASIFFDFRCVYGKEILINDLRNHVNQAMDNKSVFFYHLAQSIQKFKPPLSLFGNIVGKNVSGEEVDLDIKVILLPVIGFIRLYALNNKLTETNSLARIKQLYLQQVINKSIYDELVLSYNYLMQLRFRFQSQSISTNMPPNNIVDVNRLTHIEIATLKKIFGEIGNFQSKINFDFKGTM